MGGPFVPGIDAGPLMADETTYDGPFRISPSIEPGDLTEGLGVPWQAGFNLAAGEFTIFANQRMVYNQDMVDHWQDLGFLARDHNADELMYVETDRAPGF